MEKDWNIPKKNSHESQIFFGKKIMKSMFPGVIRIYHSWRNN